MEDFFQNLTLRRYSILDFCCLTFQSFVFLKGNTRFRTAGTNNTIKTRTMQSTKIPTTTPMINGKLMSFVGVVSTESGAVLHSFGIVKVTLKPDERSCVIPVGWHAPGDFMLTLEKGSEQLDWTTETV